MSKLLRKFGVCLFSAFTLSLFVTSAVAFADSCVWNGVTTSWSASSNWTSCSGSIPDAADSVTFNDTSTVSATADADATLVGFTISASYTGEVDFTSQNLDLNGNFSQAGGTFTAPTTMAIVSDFSQTGGSFVNNGGEVVFDGVGIIANIDVPSTITFEDLTINLGASGFFQIASGDILEVDGVLSLTDGYFGTGGSAHIDSNGTVVVENTFGYTNNGANGGTTEIHLDGGALSFTATGGDDDFYLPYLVVDNGLALSTSVLDSSEGDSLEFKSLSLLDGDFNNNGTTVPITIVEDFYTTGSTTFGVGAGSLVADTFTMSGTSEFSGGTASLIYYDGIVDLHGGNYSGGSATTITVDSISFTVNNGASSVDLSGVGTLDLESLFALTTGTFTAPTTMNVGGSFIQAGGTFIDNGGEVIFDGVGIVATINVPSSITFGDLTAGVAAGWVQITSGDTVTVSGDVGIDVGNLYLGTGNTLNVGGNWSKASGSTFLPQSGEVIFNGSDSEIAQTVSGSTTFYDLTKQTAGTWEFEAGETQTIEVGGTFTAEGTGTGAGALFLRSSVADSAWILAAGGSETLDYIDVKDSNNTGAEIVATTNANDSGGNTNWNFSGATGFTAGLAIPEFSTYMLMLSLLMGGWLIQRKFKVFAKEEVSR